VSNHLRAKPSLSIDSPREIEVFTDTHCKLNLPRQVRVEVLVESFPVFGGAENFTAQFTDHLRDPLTAGFIPTAIDEADTFIRYLVAECVAKGFESLVHDLSTTPKGFQ